MRCRKCRGGSLAVRRRVRQEMLAIIVVAELARVQRGGDGLNSGEFSYRQELLPHRPTAIDRGTADRVDFHLYRIKFIMYYIF